MSLKEQLKQRRIDDGKMPDPCYSRKERPSMLELEASSGEAWVLPWHHLVVGRHEEEGERETLRLTFVGHEVVIRGVNLKNLAEEIAHQRLAGLRTAPEEYLRATGREVFVLEIEVRSREEVFE